MCMFLISWDLKELSLWVVSYYFLIPFSFVVETDYLNFKIDRVFNLLCVYRKINWKQWWYLKYLDLN